ncbi:M23 family metallopeptidase [Paenibacillus naphthalenovorans]|uniref:M23 family metallopeptidase n=1 Tax=Paenibacillus naphthalenovorans TaxID=162209 RepID=UPI003D2DF72E
MRIALVPRITAGYGEIDSVHKTPHTGVDVGLPSGSPILAPEGGIISRIVDYGDTSLGKAVFIKTRAGYQYIFGHLSDNSVVRVGDRIHAGDIIGLSGNTGNSTGPHVHIGLVDKAGAFVDPTSIVPYDPAKVGLLGQIIGRAVDNAQHSAQESARSMTYDIAIGIAEGLRDLVVDASYAIALLGAGLAIILHAAGWEKGTRWAGMLTVGYVLIKYLAA